MPRGQSVVAMALALAASVGEPTHAGVQPSPFRSGVDVVGMHVTVTDDARRFVRDLDQRDFLVVEDGRPQQVTFFHTQRLPLALAVLIDTSASMDQHMLAAQEAAAAFVRELGPTDVAAIIDFDSRVEVRQAFTSDQRLLDAAIRATRAGGATALFNAVYIALKELNKTGSLGATPEPQRRAIIVLSDGEDTSSLLGFEEVLDLASRSDVAIYAIGLLQETGPGRESSGAPFVLRRLAERTGGQAFFPRELRELSGVYGAITAELSNQYYLAYESDNPRQDGGYRRLAVRVDRPGVVARARPGYYAPRR